MLVDINYQNLYDMRQLHIVFIILIVFCIESNLFFQCGMSEFHVVFDILLVFCILCNIIYSKKALEF